MDTLSFLFVWSRFFFIPTPSKATGAAAIFAMFIEEAGTHRMFMHAMRHTDFDTVDGLEADIRAAQAINFNHWVEVDYHAYITRSSVVVLATGQVIRTGDRMRGGKSTLVVSEDMMGDTTVRANPYALPTAEQVKRLNNGLGYTL